MTHFPTSSMVHLFAAAVHAVTYTAAAVYTAVAEQHHDFCPFYATGAMASFLILGVVYNDERGKCAARLNANSQ